MIERDEELYTERAGILEFDGGHSRQEAERLAAIETEAHRHQCEVRHVAAIPTQQARAHYLGLVLQKRGKAAHDRLRADAMAEYMKGKK